MFFLNSLLFLNALCLVDVYTNEVLWPKLHILFLRPVVFTALSICTKCWSLFIMALRKRHNFLLWSIFFFTKTYRVMLYFSQYSNYHLPWLIWISWFGIFVKLKLMINVISGLCVLSCELLWYADEQNTYHNCCIGMVSLQCKLSDEVPD